MLQRFQGDRSNRSPRLRYLLRFGHVVTTLCFLLSIRASWSQGLQAVGSGTSFPATQVGATAQQSVVLQVTGGPLSITSFSFANSQDGVAEYVAGSAAGCVVDGSTPNPQGTLCIIPVTFQPAYPGVRREPLTAITSGGTFYVGVSGTGQAAQVSLTPGTLSTVAGTGTTGNAGNNGAATLATLTQPGRTAVDYQGNVYVADTGNNAIREIVASTGNIILLAGNGTACAAPAATCGDGGLATDANLSSPASVAVDAAGDLFIADSGDNRVRRVDASTGIITTVAGNGGASYAGDGGQATAASIGNPKQVAVDFAENLYIAAAGDNAVRYVSASTGSISTVAGDGTLCSPSTAVCGDGGTAGSGGSKLNAPEGVALDGSGDLYIADTGDNRVRRVDAMTGTITTVAGSGVAGYGGDGGAATSAELNGVTDVEIDAAGNLYLADAGNAAIRLVLSYTGTIATVAGNGTACASATAACGDGGVSTGANFISPQNAAIDSQGNLYVADQGANRIREVFVVQPTFTFDTVTAGFDSGSNPERVLVTNIGNAALTATPPSTGTNPAFTQDFSYDVQFSVCPLLTPSSSPATLPPGYGCDYAIDFRPTMAGVTTGSMTLKGSGLNNASGTATVLLTGSATQIFVANTLTSSTATANFGDAVTFTDTIPLIDGIVATGTVSFYNGSALLGTVAVPSSGIVPFTTSALPLGVDSVDAAYSGDATYFRETSNTVTVTVKYSGGPDSLTTSTTTPSFGQAVTLTDTLPVLGGTAPTGTVTFYNGSTSIGAGAVNASGVATLTTGALPVGANSITAVYGGDTNYGSATSNAVTVTVAKAGGADTLATSNATSMFGQAITFTDTIPAVGGTAPTGTVTFYIGSTSIGAGAVNASGVATLTTGSLPVGTDSITAVYGGDSDYGSVTSNAVTVTVAKASGADVLAVSNAAPMFGQTITFTDSIPVAGGVAPTGTVTFLNGANSIGTEAVNASGVATLITGSLPVGTDSITAVYGGDSNYGSVTSNAVTVTVAKASGAGMLTVSNAAPMFGQAITLTDTIAVVAGVAPTGTVTFSNGTNAIGTGSVDASGLATLTTGSLPVGSNMITAVYGGDANYGAGGSNAVTVTVARASGADTLTVSNNAPMLGQAITFTDSIPVVGGVGPTGSVTFISGANTIGTGAVNASGVAMLTTAALPAGTDSISAVFGGDNNYGSATSNAVTVTVARAGGAETLTVSNAAPVSGQAITFTDTIPVVGGFPPTGTVTFLNGANAIGTGTVSASGVATLTTAALPIGTDSVTAMYGGDSNYMAGTSNAVTVVVVSPLVGATSVLTTSTGSSVFGQMVTFADTLSGNAGVTPTGTVTFYDGTTALGTSALNSAGVATLATSTLSVGSHSISGVYSGDGAYLSGTSNVDSVMVGPGNFTVAATPANQTVMPGEAAIYTISFEGATMPFDGVVTLSAIGQPAGSSVSFSPPSLTPYPGPATTTMTIMTAPGQAGVRWPDRVSGIGYAVILLPLLGWRRFRMRLRGLSGLLRRTGLLTVMLAAAMVAGALAGCGSGNFSEPHLYTITVTGTSGTLQHSTTVTLIVQ